MKTFKVFIFLFTITILSLLLIKTTPSYAWTGGGSDEEVATALDMFKSKYTGVSNLTETYYPPDKEDYEGEIQTYGIGFTHTSGSDNGKSWQDANLRILKEADPQNYKMTIRDGFEKENKGGIEFYVQRDEAIQDFSSEEEEYWTSSFSVNAYVYCNPYTISALSTASRRGQEAKDFSQGELDALVFSSVEAAIEAGGLCSGSSAQPTTPVNKVEGRVFHIDKTSFEGATVRVRSGEERLNSITDSEGNFSIEIEGDPQKASVIVSLDTYVTVPVSKSMYTIDSIVLATREEYEQEATSYYYQFLADAGINDAATIANKLEFDYTSRDSTQAEKNTIYFSNQNGENYWVNPSLENLFHELGHIVIYNIHDDYWADINMGDHSLTEAISLETGYDEGRAHFFAHLMYHYMKNTDSVLKLAKEPIFSNYNFQTIGTDDGGLVETIVVDFWIDYYKKQISSDPTGVFEDFIRVHDKHKELDEGILFGGRPPRTIHEWIETKSYMFWNEIILDDLRLREHNNLIKKAILKNIKVTRAVFWAEGEFTYEPDLNRITIETGKFHHVAGPLDTVDIRGLITVKPHSEWVLNITEEGVPEFWLKEGYLDILDSDGEVIGVIETDSPFIQFVDGELVQLNDERIAFLKSIDITQDLEDSGDVSTFSRIMSIASVCVLLFGAIVVGIFVFKKKEKRIIVITLIGVIFSAIFLYVVGEVVSGFNSTDDDTGDGSTSSSTDLEVFEGEDDFLYNETFEYTLSLGEVDPWISVYENDYDYAEKIITYCIETAEEGFEAPDCSEGEAFIFDIYVFTPLQYEEEVVEGEYGDYYTMLDFDGTYYFAYVQGGGFYPDDAPTILEVATMLEDSFEVLNSSLE